MGIVGLFGILGDAGYLGTAAHSNKRDPASPVTNPLPPRSPHCPARAKHVIQIYLNGGPSQVDTFDPKPLLHSYPRVRVQSHGRTSVVTCPGRSSR